MKAKGDYAWLWLLLSLLAVAVLAAMLYSRPAPACSVVDCPPWECEVDEQCNGCKCVENYCE